MTVDETEDNKGDGSVPLQQEAKRPLIVMATSKKKKSKKRPRDSNLTEEFEADPVLTNSDDNTSTAMERDVPLVIPAQEDTFKKAPPIQREDANPPPHPVKQEEYDEHQHDDVAETNAAVRALEEQAGVGQTNGDSSQSKTTMIISGNVRNNLQETRQYNADLEHLPDELSETADAYQRVPIAEFGAALLRGMGWKGQDSDNDKNNKTTADALPRPHRLGLGAIPAAPPPSSTSNSSRLRRPDQFRRDQAMEAQQARYQKEREAQVVMDRQRTMQNGSLVVLRDGPRARIQQWIGVPGLNRVSVELEQKQSSSDRETSTIIISRSEIDRLLTRDELEKRPFRESPLRSEERPVARRSSEKEKESKIRNGDTDRFTDKKKRSRREEEESDRSRRKGNDKLEKRSVSLSKKSSKKGSDERRPTTSITWLIPHIRVRVISEKLGRRYFKTKGVVVDVTPAGATLQMELSGIVLDPVPERYLETALPKVGGRVVVLAAGPHQHARGRLLERNSRQGVIQDDETLEVHSLSLDDMAEWCGS